MQKGIYIFKKQKELRRSAKTIDRPPSRHHKSCLRFCQINLCGLKLSRYRFSALVSPDGHFKGWSETHVGSLAARWSDSRHRSSCIFRSGSMRSVRIRCYTCEGKHASGSQGTNPGALQRPTQLWEHAEQTKMNRTDRASDLHHRWFWYIFTTEEQKQIQDVSL